MCDSIFTFLFSSACVMNFMIVQKMPDGVPGEQNPSGKTHFSGGMQSMEVKCSWRRLTMQSSINRLSWPFVYVRRSVS